MNIEHKIIYHKTTILNIDKSLWMKFQIDINNKKKKDKNKTFIICLNNLI